MTVFESKMVQDLISVEECAEMDDYLDDAIFVFSDGQSDARQVIHDDGEEDEDKIDEEGGSEEDEEEYNQ